MYFKIHTTDINNGLPQEKCDEKRSRKLVPVQKSRDISYIFNSASLMLLLFTASECLMQTDNLIRRCCELFKVTPGKIVVFQPLLCWDYCLNPDGKSCTTDNVTFWSLCL